MRLSVRIGAAALIVCLIIVVGRLFNVGPEVPRPPAPWIFNVGSRPDPSELEKWKSRWPQGESGVRPQHYDTSEIVVPNDRIIVMARKSNEDTSWVSADLAEYVRLV